jgi:hypothetical protein
VIIASGRNVLDDRGIVIVTCVVDMFDSVAFCHIDFGRDCVAACWAVLGFGLRGLLGANWCNGTLHLLVLLSLLLPLLLHMRFKLLQNSLFLACDVPSKVHMVVRKNN